MIKMIKAEAWHLYSLNNALRLIENQIAMKVENFIQVCNIGTAFTMMEDGSPVGSVGVVPYWPGVGELWALISDNLRDRPILLHKTALRIIDQIQREGKFHRLQVIVLENFEPGKRWVEHLKFNYEGLLQKYGEDKQNYCRFARIF